MYNYTSYGYIFLVDDYGDLTLLGDEGEPIAYLSYEDLQLLMAYKEDQKHDSV